MAKFLDNLHKDFNKGGKYEKWYPLYEAVDTIFQSPSKVTQAAPHMRDGVDLKRIMISVWFFTFPALLWGCYNIGQQAFTSLQYGYTLIDDWHATIYYLLTFGQFQPEGAWNAMAYGLSFYLPIYATVFIVGGFWEVLFAIVRGHEINEGFFVTSILFSLILPPTLPLWMAAIGITFGIVVGKEIFGGTGKNFLNPALTARVFLYFAYPSAMTGDVWQAISGSQTPGTEDAYTRATPLGLTNVGQNITDYYSWTDTFLGNIPGSIAEVSSLMIAIGGIILIIMRIASWRIVVGCFLGLIVTSLFFNLLSGFGLTSNPEMAIPFYWHMTIGGFCFAAFFMATDPVSASMTNRGRLYFGILIGVMTVFIRVLNPAYPEGIMLAILFANVFAPTIDYLVIESRSKKRLARSHSL